MNYMLMDRYDKVQLLSVITDYDIIWLVNLLNYKLTYPDLN